MNQEPIGHAAGHQISAEWNFVNPRFGLTYRLNEGLSIFGSYGKAEKEPADGQIINADEWSFTPGGAYPERIYDAEFGLNQTGSAHSLSLNLYRIKLENEVIQTISFEEEGYYEYSQVDETIHQGVELDASWQMSSHLKVSANGAISQNFYAAGELKGDLLSNRPAVLANATAAYTPFSALQFRAHVQHVGKRYIDSANSEENAIAAYTLLNLGASYRWKSLKVSAKVHNVLDSLYVTHGEDWGWGWIAYWPGATRNFYLTLSYDL
jgi:iron complex outermembrane receptor protein